MSNADAALARMLEPSSIAVVGASARAGSFGERMALEALRSPAGPRVHLVNPRHRSVLGHRCVPGLDALDEPVDLVLLGVPDAALADQLKLAADRGAGGAVVFGPAEGMGAALTATATGAGMALCGGSCMGFVNVARGIRAVGYLEPFPLEVGPVALVSHSGSAFSALLRTHRHLAYSLAVSSGQELVSGAADYLHHALSRPETGVVALLLETLRDAAGMRTAFAAAAEADIPVVALTVGGSPTGRAMVGAHSGAVAGDDAGWEALFDAHGVHRVADLDEMVDTLELFVAGRRPRPGATALATVHDSGAERALVADVADELGVDFAVLRPETRAGLARLLDPGLAPDNPLDVWRTGADTRGLLAGCLQTLGRDPGVGAVALAVDLVAEYDGDDSYVVAALDAAAALDIPVAVLSNIAAAVDQGWAGQLRRAGVPVLEGTRNGLAALGHLLRRASAPRPPVAAPVDAERAASWAARLAAGPLGGNEAMRLLADYGVPVPATVAASDAASVLAAAERIGYPVVLKTDQPGLAHRSDVGGVVLGLADPSDLDDAYAWLASELGARVLVQEQVPAGVELGLGILRDPALGPLLVLAAGGMLIEVLAQRVVALPPLDDDAASRLLARLPAARLLDGVRGRPVCDRDCVVQALVALSQLALELGDHLDAVDLNPLVVTPAGAVAVDALVVARPVVPVPR